MAIDKKPLRERFSRNWKKYYNLKFFKDNGFVRKKCSKCGINFWTQDTTRKICGDSNCIGGYTFIGNSPAKIKLDYTDTWKRFSKIMSQQGYTEIPRYPVIARWRDDTWFTQASIYCFQPHVISGEVKPPANPLVIPQPSLRFNDIENVGITGSHYTCHIHVGQHGFYKPASFKPTVYLSHIYTWLVKGLKIPSKEIIFHEEVWAGGGSFGPCIEYFVGGLELGNQVYQQFKGDFSKSERLKISTLDMGGGLERMCWITQGTLTSYEIIFDPVDKKYMKKLGIKFNKKILSKFAKYSGIMNFEEVKNMDEVWKNVAQKIGINVKELKKTILPFQAFYSILDHVRTLLFALVDGALPSNSGGGYNLRFILRRTLRLTEEFNWNADLSAIAIDLAKSLKPLYPELVQSLPDVIKILEIEEQKYKETKQKNKIFLGNLIKKQKGVTTSDLIRLYDSHGILPEEIRDLAAKNKIKVVVPNDFYSKVAEQHTQKEIKISKELGQELDAPPTSRLYLNDEYTKEFQAKVLDIIDKRYVLLDETRFYPTMGGQEYDIGTINGQEVLNVEKWGKHILHEIRDPKLKKGSIVFGEIDFKKRLHLMRHHTATHIINGIARDVLGNHIWQAGSEVLTSKARLDITHYANLTKEEIALIEKRANEVVLIGIDLKKEVLPKDEAEKKYGFRLYQGGAIPGNTLRVVEIPGIDVEACGGTHVNNTSEVGYIKIVGSKKIQDGVVRLEFIAGEPGIAAIQNSYDDLLKACKVFRVQPAQLARTCERFFTEWKKQKKEIKKLKKQK